MNKHYESPQIEALEIEVEGIICASNPSGGATSGLESMETGTPMGVPLY